MGSARDVRRKVQIISPRGILKPQSDHVSKRGLKPKSRRREPAVDHPAVTELTETLVKYKSQVVARQRTSISQTYFDLCAQLAHASTQCEQRSEEQRAIRQALTAPFQDDVLEFRKSSSQRNNAATGETRTVTAKLGERVAQFERRSQRKLSLLDELWASWQKCNSEAVAASRELAQAVESEEKIMEAMEDNCADLGAKLEETCSSHIAACEKGETEFDLRKSESRKSMLRLLKAQIL